MIQWGKLKKNCTVFFKAGKLRFVQTPIFQYNAPTLLKNSFEDYHETLSYRLFLSICPLRGL
jgi:hypothetical protein